MIKNHQLAHALALYRSGSFRRAASEQKISQPAFSRSIRSLETYLDATLFDRRADGAVPTVYGEALLKRAEKIMEEADELEREIRLLKELGTGELAVAMGPYPAELSGVEALGELVRDHPRLRYHINLSDWRKVADSVLDRSVDLGLAEISGLGADNRLYTEVVGKHELVLFCREAHPLAKLSEVSNHDLDRYPFVTVRIPARMAPSFPGMGVIEADSRTRIPSVEVEDLTTAREIVKKSNALSGATPIQIQSWEKTGGFVVIPYRAAWFKLNYGFIYRRDRMLSPAAKAFIQKVRSIEKDIASRNSNLIKQIFAPA